MSTDPSPEPDDATIAAAICNAKTIAIVGASQKPVRPSYGVMGYLLRAGYRVIPVNPGHAGREIQGQKVYARLADIPEPVDLVDIFRQSSALAGVVDEALSLLPLPRVIWMQLRLRDEVAAARAREAGLTVIMDRCTLIEHQRYCGATPDVPPTGG